VTGKGRVGEYHVVHIDAWAVNQLGEKTAWGNAEVYLPSRQNGPVRLPVPPAEDGGVGGR
jgi:hypothetical protein